MNWAEKFFSTWFMEYRPLFVGSSIGEVLVRGINEGGITMSNSIRKLKDVQFEDIQDHNSDLEAYHASITRYPITYGAVETMRTTAKELYQMLGEHVDNLRDAGATECYITITEGSHADTVGDIIISDNGSGMDDEKLQGAFSLGNIQLRSRKKGDTGKFGIGGTLSALCHYDKKETFTLSSDGELLCRAYDMQKVEEVNEWHSFPIQVGEEAEKFFRTSQRNNKTGTTIRLTRPRRKKRLPNTISNAKKILSQKYYNDINRKDLTIILNGEVIEAACPVMADHVDAKVAKKTVRFEGQKSCSVTMVDLSNVNTIGSVGSMQAKAGIYFRREGVLLEDKPCWFGDNGIPPLMTSKRQNDSNCRIVVDFSATKDDIFGVPNSKDKVDLSQPFADKLGDTLRSFAVNVRRLANQGGTARSRNVRGKVAERITNLAKGAALPKGLTDETYVDSVDYMTLGSSVPLAIINDCKLMVNTSHPFYDFFLSSSEEKTLVTGLSQQLCYLSSETEVLAEIEAQYEGDSVALAAARQAISRMATLFDEKLRKADT